MVSSPSVPKPPDPVATAQAQGQINKDTAVSQARLNNVNQVTPYGSLTYTAGPEVNGVPQYTATTTLSPEQQNLYNLGTQTQTNLGQIGVDQSGKVRDILNTPFDLNSSISTQQADIAKTLLDPVWQQREGALRTRLANQGIAEGSEAYTNAMRDFGMQRDNAYNSALLQGRSQAEQEALTQRNQPLNEITALLGGSQVQQPSFTNTPSTGIQPANYEGDVAQNYAGQLQAYNAQTSQNNAMLGGLFGLAAAPLGGWAYNGFKLSDERLKEDIEEVGETDGGLPIYTYRYKGEPTVHMGVMAQEVEKMMPEAVRNFGKFKAVNYEAIH
jgi:hypothetical protein